ncbi:MAG TPA: hypothetical protein VJ954_01165 [Ignavibacteriaceae bacterium]|nr:hypothetical protein [Ignavibacteriaceae bacterium]
MKNYICKTCGVQYESSAIPPERCIICEDERQYVGYSGQKWTTLTEIQAAHKNAFEEMEPGITSIITRPGFAIGQRAFLVQTNEGNVLWDCITLLDDETINEINKRGGISAIAISHPHYYSTIIEWSKAFGNAPIYIHKSDSEWVVRKNGSVKFWEGETFQIKKDATLIRCGGHFDGGAVMHWSEGADGKGVLFSGDIIQVVPDRRFVSFMYSYPNLIPLNEKSVNHIINSVDSFKFDRIYGAFQHRHILSNAKEAIKKSAERYINAIR